MELMHSSKDRSHRVLSFGIKNCLGITIPKLLQLGSWGFKIFEALDSNNHNFLLGNPRYQVCVG